MHPHLLPFHTTCPLPPLPHPTPPSLPSCMPRAAFGTFPCPMREEDTPTTAFTACTLYAHAGWPCPSSYPGRRIHGSVSAHCHRLQCLPLTPHSPAAATPPWLWALPPGRQRLAAAHLPPAAALSPRQTPPLPTVFFSPFSSLSLMSRITRRACVTQRLAYAWRPINDDASTLSSRYLTACWRAYLPRAYLKTLYRCCDLSALLRTRQHIDYAWQIDAEPRRVRWFIAAFRLPAPHALLRRTRAYRGLPATLSIFFSWLRRGARWYRAVRGSEHSTLPVTPPLRHSNTLHPYRAATIYLLPAFCMLLTYQPARQKRAVVPPARMNMQFYR